MRGFALYILSGLSAVGLAMWLSSQWGGKAFSQTPQTVQPVLKTTPTVGLIPTSTPNNLTVLPTSEPKKERFAENTESKIPDLLVGIIEDYNYTAAGKRDPFTPFERTSNTPVGPIWPLQKYDLEQLKLVGIIWEVKIPKAMILDPSGHGYVVTVNERVGRNNGYIARIREGEIVVVENLLGVDGKSNYVTKIMKLHPQ